MHIIFSALSSVCFFFNYYYSYFYISGVTFFSLNRCVQDFAEMNGKSGERRNIPRSLRLFEITADFPANLARAASCDIIATRVQPKPSSIHPRRTRVWLKTPRLPTNITVKERAEQFRAIAVPLIQVVFRLKKLKKKTKKKTLEYF